MLFYESMIVEFEMHGFISVPAFQTSYYSVCSHARNTLMSYGRLSATTIESYLLNIRWLSHAHLLLHLIPGLLHVLGERHPKTGRASRAVDVIFKC